MHSIEKTKKHVAGVAHARRVIDGMHDRIERALLAGARLMARVHDEDREARHVGSDDGTARDLIYEQLGEMLDELTAIEMDVDEAVSHLPEPAPTAPEAA